jgi:N utilization substance protein B
LTLQILYLIDVLAPRSPDPLIELAGLKGNREQAARHLLRTFRVVSMMEQADEGAEAPAEDDRVIDQALELLMGTLEERDHLDELIGRVARNWRVERMAIVDRNIMRVSTFELLYVPAVPAKVAINEGIELAKRFGTAESGAFVNGILDKVRQDQKQEEA